MPDEIAQAVLTALRADKKVPSDAQDAVLAQNSAGAIRRYAFPAGTVLFRQGEARHCAYLLDKGTVHIIGNEGGNLNKLLCVLGPGEIFGEMALVDGAGRTAMAVTASDAEIFVIPRDALQDRMKGLDPMLSWLLGLLLERYRAARFNLPESMRQQGISAPGGRGYPLARLVAGPLLDGGQEAAMKDIKLEQEIRRALEAREFVPVLQPIVNLTDRRLVGFETLIRWHHPERGLIMPNDFIPVAERAGLVQRLDRIMLERACELLPHLQRQAGGAAAELFVTVNLSGLNFGSMEVVKSLEQIFGNSAINPAHIHLEITESALIGDAARAESVLRQFRGLGVPISLDDFGTGYSSLGYLHKFTIDTLKIDRSFVSQLHNGKRSVDIVRAIIALARSFDLGIVAEGIEREEDVAILRELGCDMGQGYLFGRPLSVEDAHLFINKNLAPA